MTNKTLRVIKSRGLPPHTACVPKGIADIITSANPDSDLQLLIGDEKTVWLSDDIWQAVSEDGKSPTDSEALTQRLCLE